MGAQLLLAVCLLLSGAAAAQTISMTVYDQIEIARTPVGDVRPDELSALAWDADEQLLYAVSDKGRVFHYRLVLNGTRIRELTPLYGAALVAADGTRQRFNAEGLTLIGADNGRRGDTQLLMTIENGQRLMRFTPQGRALGEQELPAPLADTDNYRGSNNGLEAVAVHARHGILVAPQQSLRGSPSYLHTVYAVNGKTWAFERAPGGEVKAIEALDDGGLLVLERPRGAGARLRRVDLGACGGDTPCAVTDLLDPGALAVSDNYEGLARLPGNLFLIVSDNGKNPQRLTRLTLLGLHRQTVELPKGECAGLAGC